METAAQRRGRAYGQIELFGLIIALEAAVEGVGEPLAGGVVAGGAGVGVYGGIRLLEQTDSSLVDHRGRGHAGVAQGEVIDVFPAHHGGALVAVFKKLPNHGTGGAQIFHSLRNHNRFTLLFSWMGAL